VTANLPRRLVFDDTDAVATVLRRSYDWALPHLAGRHTLDEDRAFVRGHLFASNELWGAYEAERLIGYIGFHPGWIDHLYVLPDKTGQGIGSSLLDIAKARERQLDLWTFQVNTRARRFYQSRGFIEVERTDGAGNEECEPDVRYRWASGR
jgi:putative acetyltransferase